MMMTALPIFFGVMKKLADFMREQKFEDFIVTCYNDAYKIIAIAIVLAYDFSVQQSRAKYH